MRTVLPLNTCDTSIIGYPAVLITCTGASLALAIDADLQGDDDLICQKLPLRSAVHRRKMAIMIGVEDGGNDAPEYSGTKIHRGCTGCSALRPLTLRHCLACNYLVDRNRSHTGCIFFAVLPAMEHRCLPSIAPRST